MAIVQLLLTLFLLFYFFRDRSKVLATVRSLLPLSGAEADRLFSRVYETVHATIYGTVLVALVQGALGGLMFWWLGLPAPLLWGVVMALLAIVPVFGAFIIWIPAAIFLAMSGQWGKAMILTGWGAVVIGLVDNLLYPMFVGSKLRMHTVPVFIAIVGGLALFGGSGLVLGPVTLAVTIALVEVWRRRTAAGGTAEEGVHAPAPARESSLSAEPPKEHAAQ
jgi:predicted PurR-regulated permease PerM